MNCNFLGRSLPACLASSACSLQVPVAPGTPVYVPCTVHPCCSHSPGPHALFFYLADFHVASLNSQAWFSKPALTSTTMVTLFISFSVQGPAGPVGAETPNDAEL